LNYSSNSVLGRVIVSLVDPTRSTCNTTSINFDSANSSNTFWVSSNDILNSGFAFNAFQTLDWAALIAEFTSTILFRLNEEPREEEALSESILIDIFFLSSSIFALSIILFTSS
jgi:hypothetical protein